MAQPTNPAPFIVPPIPNITPLPVPVPVPVPVPMPPMTMPPFSAVPPMPIIVPPIPMMPFPVPMNATNETAKPAKADEDTEQNS